MATTHDPTTSVNTAEPATLSPVADPNATLTAVSVAAADSNSPTAITNPLSASARRYQLHDEIARGGMGVIYRAIDTAFGREVAVKVLQEKFGPETGAARRFADEARITGQLQHPAVPPVHDIGTLPDGRPFLAMKLIKGQTLDDLLKVRAEVSAERGRFLAAFEQVCQALAYAHAHKVIHRDLKPANVMVGSFGEVQVMDWGLAKVLSANRAETIDPDETAAPTAIQSLRDSDGSATQAGSVMGTPAFMPPEQAVGALGKIDARSDVFGLGAILAVILTGKPPFAANSLETTRIQAAQGNMEDCFARLDACGAEPDLVVLCKRCLSPKPANRPADAGVVATEVAELRAAADERARQAELDRVAAEGQRAAAELRAVEQRKRRRVQLALAAAVAVLLAGGGAVAWWEDHQSGRIKQGEIQRQAELDQAELKRKADLDQVVAERKADIILQKADAEKRAQAELERLKRNVLAIESLLDQVEDALKDDDPAKANVPLTLAERRAAEGGADQLANRLKRRRLEYNISLALDKAVEFQWATEGGDRPPEAASAVWAGAFQQFGIVLGTTEPNAAARLVHESIIQDKLLLGLDRWYAASRMPQLRPILTAADPDPFRESARIGIALSDRAIFQELARDPRVFEQPVRFAAVLGGLSQIPFKSRELILLPAVNKSPGDISLLLTITSMYKTHGLDDGNALAQRFRWAQAAVAARPKNKISWRHLGAAYWDQGAPSEAVACYRRALDFDPNDAYTNAMLAGTLVRNGEPREALKYAQKAVELAPEYTLAHNYLAVTLERLDDWQGAVRAYRKAVDVNPDYALPHLNLAEALLRNRDADGAIRACRGALRIDPNYKEAISTLRRALQHRELLPRLSNILAGKAEPKTPAEACEFAKLCSQPSQMRFVDAVRLYEKAFVGDRMLIDDLVAAHRYNAACYAARAARGDGIDAPTVPVERAVLRGKALAWLRADLASRTKQLESGLPGDRATVRQCARHWQRDSDLADIRDEAALAKLPPEERKAFTQFWSDVAALLKVAEEQKK